MSDSVDLKIRNPFFFVSQANGKTMLLADTTASANVPRQLPYGVKEEEIIKNANTAKNAIGAIVIIQIII